MSNIAFYDLILNLVARGRQWCDKYEADEGKRPCVRGQLDRLADEVDRRLHLQPTPKKEDHVQLIDLIALDQRSQSCLTH
jgi:hypothetical protein